MLNAFVFILALTMHKNIKKKYIKTVGEYVIYL